MAGEDLGEEIPEIGGDGDVPALVPPLGRETGPLPQNPSTVNRAAEREHRGRVAMIGPAVSVLVNRAAELGHRKHHDVVHPVAQIGGECCEAVAELLEARRELTFTRALIHVGVPAGRVGEGDLESDAGLDELGDLEQGVSQPAVRIRFIQSSSSEYIKKPSSNAPTCATTARRSIKHAPISQSTSCITLSGWSVI